MTLSTANDIHHANILYIKVIVIYSDLIAQYSAKGIGLQDILQESSFFCTHKSSHLTAQLDRPSCQAVINSEVICISSHTLSLQYTMNFTTTELEYTSYPKKHK